MFCETAKLSVAVISIGEIISWPRNPARSIHLSLLSRELPQPLHKAPHDTKRTPNAVLIVDGVYGSADVAPTQYMVPAFDANQRATIKFKGSHTVV